MTITYNKKFPANKYLSSGGPRDQQRRQAQEFRGTSITVPNVDQMELIVSLKAQVELLKRQATTKGLTGEQVDEEIIKAVKEETAKHRKYVKDLKKIVKKYEETVRTLENDVIQLKGSIENKDVLIEQLKQIKVVAPAEKFDTDTDTDTVADYDEVEIDPVFIDPIEKDFEPLEEHLDIDTTLTVTKKGMNEKVGKLKALLGKM